MTPETETESPTAGINGADSSDTTITGASDTISESSATNGGQGRGPEGCTGRGDHQVPGSRSRCFSGPSNTSLIIDFKGEVDDFDTFLGTTDKQIEPQDH